MTRATELREWHQDEISALDGTMPAETDEDRGGSNANPTTTASETKHPSKESIMTKHNPAPISTGVHPDATQENIEQLCNFFELSLTELGALYMILERRPEWHPEAACLHIVDAREHGNDGITALVACILNPDTTAHPGGMNLPRGHYLNPTGYIWDYVGLLRDFITEANKDHWKNDNCSHKSRRHADDVTPGNASEQCDKTRHAESALGFIRLATADTVPAKHAIIYYTDLAKKYGATDEQISAALFGTEAAA